MTRSPLLAARDAPNTIGPIAVDFGTSSATVTMYDGIETHRLALWPGQAATTSRGLSALLRCSDWPDPQARVEIARGFCEALGEDAGIGPDDWKALADQLDADATMDELWSADPHLREDAGARRDRIKRLGQAIHQFEDRLVSPILNGWLSVRLHEVYRAALDVAAPEAYGLTAVRLDLEQGTGLGSAARREGRDVPSRLVVGPRDEIRQARLGTTGGAALEFVGIKRYLSRPQPIDKLADRGLPYGWSGDSELLLALCYRDLVERTHAYLDNLVTNRQLERYRGHKIAQLTATYPTITPPAARDRLRDLLSAALRFPPSDVDIRYDEAVAAALYFVLRELGGDSRGGVDAMRARSRLVETGLWRRTMLVVDIGGGTTDIALLAMELREVAQPGEPNPFRGRHYQLAPTVLGTTGHNQLGGDLLTLRVFYWIKAVLADALAAAEVPGVPRLAEIWPRETTGGPIPTSLAPLVVGFRDHEAPAPLAVREVLQQILPTHSGPPTSGDAPPSPAFRKIWDEAEKAKKRLAAGDNSPFSREWLVELAHELTCRWADGVPAVGDRLEPLRAADFDRLARPVLEQAMRLAANLARRRLGTSGDPILDVVALAGRTCGMPAASKTAATVIARALVEDGGGQQLVGWNPAAIVVEEQNAKQAASIGAAWAYSRAQYHAADSDQVVADGDDQLDINVDNLLLQLPCGFTITAEDGNSPVLFEAGEEFDQFRPDGTRYRRSRWLSVQPTIELKRRIDGGRDIRWGWFRYSEFSTEPPSDVRYRVEMDQQLTPTLLLRRGTEEHRGLQPACPPYELGPSLRGAMRREGLAYLPQIQATLVGGRGPDDVVSLFDVGGGLDCWLDVQSDPVAWSGRRSFTTSNGPIRGAVAVRPLPMPPRSSLDSTTDPVRYHLHMINGPHDVLDLGVITLPHPDVALTDRYWAALDVAGRFWALSREPAIPRAATIEEMERVNGTVFETAMTDFVTDWDPVRDPHSGIH